MKIEGIQGDLLIVKINGIPAGAKRRNDKVLVYGEVTGHAHRLLDGEVFDYEDRILFTVPASTTIIHEEHDPLPLKKGDYEIIRQREYNRENMTRMVVD